MKVGDYARTKDGYIGEIEDCNSMKEYLFLLSIGNKRHILFGKNEDYKSSPNIIDLIEVGDYVNGYYVEDIRDVYDGEDTYTRICLASGCNYFQPDITDVKDIKSVLTKEQFESVEYKL